MADCKFEVEIELKTSPEKLWKSQKEFVTLFPKVMPDLFKGIDVIEGDGRSVGTVYVVTFKRAGIEKSSTLLVHLFCN